MTRIVLVVLLFSVGLTAPAAAQPTFPRIVGEETVGHFRSWSEIAQSAYVLGVYSYATYMGMQCPTVVSVGEYRAALVHNRTITDTDGLPKAMLALFVRNGCGFK